MFTAKYMEFLAQTKLFRGLEAREIAELLDCVCARVARFSKNELIIEEGDRVSEFGIILSGNCRSIKWDASDRVFIVTLLQKGSEAGALLAANPEHESTVSVQALDDTEVLFISFDRLISRCEKGCPRHETLLRNYIAIVAEKGLMLHERISCLLKPTLREKIMAYLQRESRCESREQGCEQGSQQGSSTFTIPLNRNAMAQYLNAERSALSRELSNMKRDGLIDYHRNSFKLIF